MTFLRCLFATLALLIAVEYVFQARVTMVEWTYWVYRVLALAFALLSVYVIGSI